MTAPHPDIVESTVEANGLRFATLAMGEGPLALCLHGFPDSAWTWQHLLPELAAAGFRAVAPFLRGYAPTEVPADGLYQPGAIARDAIALHEALGGDGEAVIVGHDWGALSTYAAVGHAPERWRRAVVAAVPPAATVAQAFFSYDQLQRSWYMFFFQSPLADLAVPMDDLAFIDRLWADWSPGFDGSEHAGRCKDALRDPANLAAAIGYYRATLGAGARSPECDLVEAAGALPMPVPTLYLHGRTDGCMGAELIDDGVLDALPAEGSRVELVDDAGHFLQLEQPEVVNRLIVDFLTT
ncbi:MAG: alpha/beta hydrolase [Acidimicrobiales bacterium]|nr:alpha/beta hydrolase [Acidimicrobiales bacterium]HRW36512.1 alpha/beta hydrolase [Aquihabitans sp.]